MAAGEVPAAVAFAGSRCSAGLRRAARGLLATLTIATFVAGLAPAAHASAPGDLDPTFGNGGVVVTTAQGAQLGSAEAQSANGFTVVVGAAANKPPNAGQTGLRSFLVARYTPTGALDGSFNGGLNASVSFGGFDDQALGVALEPDGRPVVVGTTSSTTNGAEHVVAIARYTLAGTLDNTFGTGGTPGKVTTVIRGIAGENDVARAVAVQGDGKIVVAGTSFTGTTSQSFVARYTAAGALDASFGTGGIVASAVPVGSTTLQNQFTGLVLDASGNLLLSATVCTANCGQASEGDSAGVVRLHPAGALDGTFGVGGLATVAAASSVGTGLALQPDGNVVVVGKQSYGVVGQNQFVVARLTASGLGDPTFGGSGVVLTAFDSNDDEARSVAVLPAIGKIAVGGFSQPGGRSITANYAVAVAQYNSDGSLDPTFGAGGRSVQAIGSGDAKGFAILGQTDTNLVVAGQFKPLPAQGVGVLRLLGEPMAISNASVTQPAPGFGPLLANFTVGLAVPSGVQITVQYDTVGGSAQPGTDYGDQHGILVFPPGATTRTISIPILPGASTGPDVSFSVVLSNAVHAALVRAVGVGTVHHQGYTFTAADGGIFTFGNNAFAGSMGGQHLNSPIVAMAGTPAHGGYWLVGRDGGIFAFGDASFHGSMGGQHLNSPIVAMAGTPDGQGYWLVGADGGIFAFGDAGFHGSMGGQHLNAPIVAIVSSPTGQGYWLVSSDGGIFGFGDVGYFGSMGGQHLNSPIVAMAVARSGQGYLLVGQDGGIFGFGTIGFFGSMGGQHLNAPIVAAAESVNGGYWLIGNDGGVFAFGDAAFYGSTGSIHLNQPIIAMSAG